jgi:hypothetical protein
MADRRQPSGPRRTLQAVERKVGEPLERAVESPAGADALAALVRLSNAGGGALRQLRGGLVHAGGLPSRRDLDALAARVARLERLIEDLALQLDDRRD